MDYSEHPDYASAVEGSDALSLPDASKVGARALKGAKRVERHMEKHSRIVSPDAELLIPRFDQSELVLGKLLGHGGFSNVYQVSLISLSGNKPDSEHTADTVEICSEEQVELRQQAFRTNNYAVKFLNAKTLNDPDRYCIGCADLVLEAKFLANLNHEHIIKLKGLPCGGVEGMAKCQKLSFFLLLDKLQSTLDIRMERWHEQENQLTNPGAVKKLFQMSLVKKKKNEFVNERLKVALDVASALEYLHEHRIIYRDLKPENIGFDLQDTVILFDFGLAKELKPGKYSETYHLTGHTGSLRFMSPEVTRYLPYNLSADSYSFGILLWYIYSLQLPFDDMSRSAHSHLVVYGGQRPPLDRHWPPTVSSLMERCWNEAPYMRPTMTEIIQALQTEIGFSETDCMPARPRSRSGSFVLNRENIAEQPRQPFSLAKRVMNRLPSASSRAIAT